MIYNIFVRDTDNVGDTILSPLDYFKFPIPAKKVDVNEDYSLMLKSGFIIWGGGGLIHLPAPDYNHGVMGYLEEFSEAKHIVAWGVGLNVHNVVEFPYPKSLEKFKLMGIRNQDNPYEWVPCVSCMNSLFDVSYEIKHDIVTFRHGGEPLSFNDDHFVPDMKATGVTAEEAIAHIASGKVVVTNSYHGAYWAMLLGRGAVVLNPFSTKFYGIHKNVQLAVNGTLINAIPAAIPDIAFLDVCRMLNRTFYRKVIGLIDEYQRGSF